MVAYKFDTLGFFLEAFTLLKGQAIPPLTTFIEPMDSAGGLDPRWNGSSWKLEDRALFSKGEPPVEVIRYNTLDWLRFEMTETYEAQCRAYGLNPSNPRYVEVQVFMDMVRDRINDYLIVSDEGYKNGVLLIEDVGIFDENKANDMLAIGNHER